MQNYKRISKPTNWGKVNAIRRARRAKWERESYKEVEPNVFIKIR